MSFNKMSIILYYLLLGSRDNSRLTAIEDELTAFVNNDTHGQHAAFGGMTGGKQSRRLLTQPSVITIS